ncbi:MAG: hypothetical protein OHK0038_20060 [Flammeovirgaceae bacterium]
MEKLSLAESVKILELIGQKVEGTFGRLSAGQLNWQPSLDSWSIGQCLKHIIQSNELYFVILQSIANGTKKSSFWEKMPFLPQLFGNLLINSIDPKNLRKSKTINKVNPIRSNVEANIVRGFLLHQESLIEKLNATSKVDAKNTVITSPFAGFIVYTLSDLYNILWLHEERHFLQAKRVMEANNFPKN